MKRDEIYRIVEAKYEDYADRVVMQTKALPEDCRQSGDDSGLEDVWEEFKYQVQTQESGLFEAYEETISAICHKLVESLPRHEQDLLWLASEGYWKANDEDGLPPRNNIVENVVTELYGRINNRAWDEDLKKDPGAELKKKQDARKKQKHYVETAMNGKATTPTSLPEKPSDSSTMRPANATPSPKAPNPPSSLWANGTPADLELDGALKTLDRHIQKKKKG